MESRQRTFTREEAEALLPEVDRLLGEALVLTENLARAASDAETAEQKVRANGKVQPQLSADSPEATRRALERQLGLLVERVRRMGIVVRDLRRGLIDFPSVRGDRVVHLCWQRGEPLELRWWHEVEAGFAGRQPL
ncbi:MAG: DUF2203 domain-containing protein [Chloroflexota bacterium]|nr:DUF2203 domain-containing protein [Chloroflexota bacterium]